MGPEVGWFGPSSRSVNRSERLNRKVLESFMSACFGRYLHIVRFAKVDPFNPFREKGKGRASEPPIDANLDAINREALMNTANLSLSQRRLVADAIEQFRGDGDVNHPNTLDFPVGFFDDARALAAHSHLRWPDLVANEFVKH
ncbi:hypothetical protein DY000_02006156 [Brassica cretica]|uniref:Uncharacterized protein n=1 Tax=Brassica cretica TaxID=69181 RepID=A0ABQ7CH24_BRACR|nr:hypothetical protein DY000_02006156 [Brassica cretica]